MGCLVLLEITYYVQISAQYLIFDWLVACTSCKHYFYYSRLCMVGSFDFLRGIIGLSFDGFLVRVSFSTRRAVSKLKWEFEF